MGMHHSRFSTMDAHAHDNKLVSLLINQNWNAVLARLEKHPKEAKNSLVIHKQTIYPLHAACALGTIPLNVVQALVKADPEGPTRLSTFDGSNKSHHHYSKLRGAGESISISSTSGDSFSTLSSSQSGNHTIESSGGWLPLHVACFYGASVEVVEFLLQRYPEGATLKNGRGMLPIHLAVLNATTNNNTTTTTTTETNVEVVKLLLQAFPESRYIPVSSSATNNNKTAYEVVVDTSTPNKESLLNLLNPTASLDGCTNKNIPRVVQSILLENNTTSSHHNTGIPHRPLAKSLRARSNSITGSTVSSLIEAGNPTLCSTKLATAIINQEWETVVKRVEKKPSEVRVWTLSDDTLVDPPCHSLPLFMALRRKAPHDVIQSLVKEYPQATLLREYYGMLSLHVACQAGASLQIVDAIYKEHPDAASIQDLTGMLPLHLAAASEACRRNVVLFLLDVYPGSIDMKDNKDMLAVDYVVNGQHPHGRLLEADFGRGLDYWAAPSDLQLISYILHQDWQSSIERAQSHPQEASVWTKHPIHGKRRYALHYACKYKAPPELVEVLLEAHPEATHVPIDEYQLLPLHLACSHGAADDVVRLLLATYVEAASIADSCGLLPLHLAITEGASINVVQLLLEAYPNARNIPDTKGFVPYVYAESSHHPSSAKIMELLKELSIKESDERSTKNKHGRGDATTSALLQTKRQKSDRSLQGGSKVAPIMVGE